MHCPLKQLVAYKKNACCGYEENSQNAAKNAKIKTKIITGENTIISNVPTMVNKILPSTIGMESPFCI